MVLIIAGWLWCLCAAEDPGFVGSRRPRTTARRDQALVRALRGSTRLRAPDSEVRPGRHDNAAVLRLLGFEFDFAADPMWCRPRRSTRWRRRTAFLDREWNSVPEDMAAAPRIAPLRGATEQAAQRPFGDRRRPRRRDLGSRPRLPPPRLEEAPGGAREARHDSTRGNHHTREPPEGERREGQSSAAHPG